MGCHRGARLLLGHHRPRHDRFHQRHWSTCEHHGDAVQRGQDHRCAASPCFSRLLDCRLYQAWRRWCRVVHLGWMGYSLPHLLVSSWHLPLPATQAAQRGEGRENGGGGTDVILRRQVSISTCNVSLLCQCAIMLDKCSVAQECQEALSLL